LEGQSLKLASSPSVPHATVVLTEETEEETKKKKMILEED
jgi:hypothetical protein